MKEVRGYGKLIDIFETEYVDPIYDTYGKIETVNVGTLYFTEEVVENALHGKYGCGWQEVMETGTLDIYGTFAGVHETNGDIVLCVEYYDTGDRFAVEMDEVKYTMSEFKDVLGRTGYAVYYYLPMPVIFIKG